MSKKARMGTKAGAARHHPGGKATKTPKVAPEVFLVVAEQTARPGSTSKNPSN